MNSEEVSLNTSTPIFLLEAEKSRENNDFERAIEICKRGIDAFPDYYLGYVLLIEAYESIGNFKEAENVFKSASMRFANNLFFRQIARRREKYGSLITQKGQTPIQSNPVIPQTEQRKDIIDVDDYNLDIAEFNHYKDINLEELSADNIELIPGLDFSPYKTSKSNKPIRDLQFFYDFLSEKIPDIHIYAVEKAQATHSNIQNEEKKTKSSESDNTNDFPNIIPTETLAEIYIRQGKFNEAVSVFEQLIEINPNKSQYYFERIGQLNNERK